MSVMALIKFYAFCKFVDERIVSKVSVQHSIQHSVLHTVDIC